MRHGSQIDPPNRFDTVQIERDCEHLAWDEEYLRALKHRRVKYFEDMSETIISENDSPDIPFRYSLNPYRGCAHGCSYCYARPSHEYLGLNAGLDFETLILVKRSAPRLLRGWLSRSSWDAQTIVLSGVTDSYQPAERQFRISRQCLEVACEFRQPISIVTKNALVTRDIDLLAEMAQHRIIHVAVSLTTLDSKLSQVMEPRTSTPQARLRTIRQLNAAGIPTQVMVAPVIPGLNDMEIPAILQAASESGARAANYILLRLPLTVKPVFLEWLERSHPTKSEMVESRIRETHSGELNDAQFGRRMRGAGVLADQIGQSFRVFARKFGLDGKLPAMDRTSFRVVQDDAGQLRLF